MQNSAEQEPGATTEGSDGTLALTRYAELLAHAVYFGAARRSETLARLGVEEPTWAATEAKWMALIVEETLQDARPVGAAFAAAYAPVLKRLKAEKPPIASIGKLDTDALPIAESMPAALSGMSMGFVAPQGPAWAFAPGAGTAPPSAASGAVPATAPAAVSGTSMVIIAPKGAALPFAARRSSAPASPWAADVMGTLDGALPRAEPALPFDPNARSTPPASGNAERLARSTADVGGTLDAPTAPAGPALPFPAAAELKGPAGFSLQQYAALCVELTAARGDDEVNEVLRRYQITAEQRTALDEHWQSRIGSDLAVIVAFNRAHEEAGARFSASRGRLTQEAARSPVSSAPALSASPPIDAPPGKRAPAALSATSISVIAPKAAALPFQPVGTATGAASEPNSAASTPASMPPIKRAPSALSGTFIGKIAPKGAVLPFDPKSLSSQPDSTGAEPPPPPAPSAEPPPGGFTLQQYASLCVELDVAPNDTDEILRRYRITAEQREAIDTHWQGRIAADPRVRTVFDQAHAGYKAWFVASRGRQAR